METIISFNEDLAVIHAYLCADGYVCKRNEKNRKYVLGLRNTNFVLLEDFVLRFKRYFGFEPHIGGGRAALNCKSAWLFLINNFGSFHSYEWTFPEAMPVNLYAFWIRAFFDCEAWVTKRKAKDRSVSFESVNSSGTLRIQAALALLGIKSTVSKRKTRSTTCLRICGRENIVLFKNKIGFLHPKKKETLEFALSTFVNYRWDFPCKEDELRGFVKAKMIEKAKLCKDNKIRFCSKISGNLLRLSELLEKYYGIKATVSKPLYSGLGAKYFELRIVWAEDVQKVINNGLIADQAKSKGA